MKDNGEKYYKMMMEVRRAMSILEDVSERLTAEYFNARPPKVHTVSSEELDVFNNKKKK